MPGGKEEENRIAKKSWKKKKRQIGKGEKMTGVKKDEEGRETMNGKKEK